MNEARLESLIRTAADAIITTDQTQRIVTFTPAAQRLFGYTLGEVLSQHTFPGGWC